MSIAWPIFMLAMILALTPAHAAEITGIVTEVHDGDSVTLVNWQATYKIRLADIDVPELKQQAWTRGQASGVFVC